MKHPIPNDALDDRLAFVGTSGSGKTYNAGGAVERLLTSGARVVIVDPLDVWWGLRLDAAGKSASRFSLPIFGGAHGDLPLNEHAGKLIGEAVATMAESCIVSLGGLPSKSAERRFMLALLETIYRTATGDPVHLIFDEADLWAPQKSSEPALQSRMEEIVRRGRVRGFIPWLITQRPAVLSKDVLSQVDGLVAFKLTSSQDRDAIGNWVEGQADKDEWRRIWASMPTLQRGTGVVWLPGRGILQTATFPEKATFDSSRTPKRGERRQTTTLKPVDLGKLKEKLATVEAETKAADPKALKAEVARLQKELGAKATAPIADPAAEQRAYERGHADGYKHAVSGIAAECAAVVDAIGRTQATAVQIGEWAKQATPPAVSRPAAPRPAPTTARIMPKPAVPQAVNGFTAPQAKVLRALAMWKALGHEAPSREMVAAASGYSPTSGGFNNLLGGLATAGAIGKPQPGRVSLLTDAGSIDQDAGRDMLLRSLSNPQRKLVDALTGADAMSRDDLGAATEYSPTSGGFNNLIGSLSTLDIVRKPQTGYVALSDWAQELLS